MIVISLFMILLRCLMLIKLDNCEKYNDEITDFLELYKMIKAHQFKNQPKQITNNIFLIPTPILSPIINKESSHEEIATASNNKHNEDNKVEAVFRDPEGSQIGEEIKVTNKPQVMRKFLSSAVTRDVFDPVKHRNWNLIPSACGLSSVDDRITGGEDAFLGQYPWMARIGFLNIYKNNSVPIFRCGASLITKTHVITAAHCVTHLPPELEVAVIRFGEYNTDTTVDCVQNRCADKVIDIKPKAITVHENYGTPIARNDIALIKLQNAITFTEWIAPICLPFGDIMTVDYTNQKGEVAGWGFYDISINKGSTILQTVQLPILKSQPCSKAFHGVLINYKKQLCVGGDLGKDSCNGDSGGPLMKVVPFNKEPKYVLLGIVSLGAKYCGLTTAPAIYTKITYYMEWILDHLY